MFERRVEATGPAVDAQAVAYALVNILKQVAAAGPVLTVIDDAQWVDLAS